MTKNTRDGALLREFKEFAIKGNVMDMAVGIVIGAAFTTVIKSLVDDLIMPPIGLLTGGLDFSEKFVVLRPGAVAGPYITLVKAKAAGATVLAYGSFVNALVALAIVSIVLFFAVKWMNRLRRPNTPSPPNTKICPYCVSTVDLVATRCAYCTSTLDGNAPSTAP